MTDSHLLAASLERIRLAQNFFRELMGAYRSVGEQEARDLCREQLDELNSILQVLTLEAALLDTQQARIASTREEERAQKLTTLALILVFPAIYLAALPYIIPTDSADLDFRVWLTVGGAAASSLFGWLASHQLVGLSAHKETK